MFRKSFVLRVISSSWFTAAVAAIIASGVFILFAFRISIVFSTTSSVNPSTTESVTKSFKSVYYSGMILYPKTSILVITEMLGIALTTWFIKVIPFSDSFPAR
jgi:hypothetical protein